MTAATHTALWLAFLCFLVAAVVFAIAIWLEKKL